MITVYNHILISGNMNMGKMIFYVCIISGEYIKLLYQKQIKTLMTDGDATLFVVPSSEYMPICRIKMHVQLR